MTDSPRNRLGQLTAVYEKQQGRLDEIALELGQLDVDEARARDDALAESPTKLSSGDGITSPVGKIGRKREKLTGEAAGLRADMEARGRAIDQARREVLTERVAETLAKLAEIRTAEVAGYQKLGKLFDAFAETWLEQIVPTVEEHTRLVTDVENDTELLNGVNAAGWDRNPYVYGIPRDLQTAFERLLIAADSMASHYQAGAFSDYRRVLPELVTERARLSGYTIPKFGNFDWVQANAEKPSWVEKPTAATGELASEIAAELLAEAAA